ncbi:dephospho-CoA kinase [Bartonella ancashensis]|uniref:Dephospho-CoA kinase n=1 Tax=Bartonella ancashensis TaxID=1318743 RepID=A0A0M4LI18_9HYPH|nr:dephospho-CoA kinase [Bartonella ancashensis]ALE03268.1 Dephospho-CoA kinase [Bartonella ancashensis]
MEIIGLTGSIAMGKSTVAGFFRDAGVPVFSADEIVHKLYQQKTTLLAIKNVFPDIIKNGQIDRLELSEIITHNSNELQKLEKIIHPLVRKEEKEFIKVAREQGEKMVVLEIPLLFEINGTDRVDHVIVVSAPLELQRERAMKRPNMSEEKFNVLNARQIPNKQKYADFVIDTGKSLEDTRQQVLCIIDDILKNA